MNTHRVEGIALEDGTMIYVEVEDTALSKSLVRKGNVDLPEGAELTSTATKTIDALKALKGMLGGVFDSVHEAIRERSPDEWSVELNIGFKGKVDAIPVIVSGESNASIKVLAKWVKPKQG